MFERYSSEGASANWRRRSGTVAASIVAHLVLLIGAVRLYHPAQPAPAPEPLSPQPVYFDLPQFPSAAPSAPVQAARGGSSASPAPRVPSRTAVARALPAQPSASAAAVPAAAPTQQIAAPTAQEAPRPTLRGAPLDPRLYLDAPAIPTSPSTAANRIEARRRAAEDSAAARRRTVTIAGRKVDVFRDSTQYRRARLELGGQWITMPGDGRDWVDLELRRQDTDAARDSVLRERARITRERNDANRGARRDP